ncbi:hypothetical protein HUJ04_003126 [Dendroctonus ponderosae]|nr:hypothetical protein HUJ04_003126 [Dendroctonus ponderosae]
MIWVEEGRREAILESNKLQKSDNNSYRKLIVLQTLFRPIQFALTACSFTVKPGPCSSLTRFHLSLRKAQSETYLKLCSQFILTYAYGFKLFIIDIFFNAMCVIIIWVCGRIFVAFELKFGAHLAFGPSKENVYFKSPPSKWTSFRKTKSMSVLMYVRNVTSGYV